MLDTILKTRIGFPRFNCNKKFFPFIVLSVILLLIAFGGFIFTMADNPDNPTYRELAEHWSPFIYQSTEGEFDYITNLAYDENIYSRDNWENFPCFSKPAYVYYAIVETTLHYFITYNFFHPKDLGVPTIDPLPILWTV